MNDRSAVMSRDQERAAEIDQLFHAKQEISKRLAMLDPRENQRASDYVEQGKQETPNAVAGQLGGGMMGVSWRYYVEQRIDFLMRRLRELEALKLALPTQMSPAAEQAMISLLTEGKW